MVPRFCWCRCRLSHPRHAGGRDLTELHSALKEFSGEYLLRNGSDQYNAMFHSRMRPAPPAASSSKMVNQMLALIDHQPPDDEGLVRSMLDFFSTCLSP